MLASEPVGGRSRATELPCLCYVMRLGRWGWLRRLAWNKSQQILDTSKRLHWNETQSTGSVGKLNRMDSIPNFMPFGNCRHGYGLGRSFPAAPPTTGLLALSRPQSKDSTATTIQAPLGCFFTMCTTISGTLFCRPRSRSRVYFAPFGDFLQSDLALLNV